MKEMDIKRVNIENLEKVIELTFNGGRGHMELNLGYILPATPANMNRIIETVMQANYPECEEYAEELNNYIRGCVEALILKRGTFDKVRQTGIIADYNKVIKRYINNSEALAKRFDIPAVTDNLVKQQPTLKKAAVESLGMDNGKRVVKTFAGVTFEYRGIQFDAYQANKGGTWEILINGTGTGCATAAKKNQIIAALNDKVFDMLNSEYGKKQVQAARELFIKTKGIEPETTATVETVAEPATEPEKELEKKTAEVYPAEFVEDIKKAAAEVVKEEVKKMENKTNMQEVKTAEPEKIDLATLTAENINDYLPALLMSLANDKHNTSIILAAGIEAGVISPSELLVYFHTGRMPAVHTFDVWKKAGYTVRKGEHAAFTARIWKYTEKAGGTFTEEEAAAINSIMINADGSDMVQAGDEKKSRDFIKKVSYFFTAAQVDKTPEPAALPELPEDVKQEIKKGCMWISGNTRPIKEDLKAAGFRWSKKNGAWYRAA